MADDLIFGVKFDLDKAVEQASGDVDATLRRLQTMINSKPLAINLKTDGADDGSINAISDRMKELVSQWNALSEAQRITNKKSGEFTSEAQQILAEYTRLTGATETYARSLQQIAAAARKSADAQIREASRVSAKQAKAFGETRRTLAATENSIKSVSNKLKLWQKALNSRDVGSQGFTRAANEVQRLTQRLTELKAATDEATGKPANINKTTEAFKKQETYVSRLIKRLAVYASFSMIRDFLTNVREVTAEFELQKVSLGAILQDQTKANNLFSQIKSFALQSPVKILDLTKYTKQLAAYKIGYEDLFETTKRLTDVSVGLGVSMDRIILMYGQIRATGYLRACLGKDTPVKMYDGSTKAVQDVVIGDKLMGDDEQPRVVSELFRGKQQMYRVKYNGGEFRCNEHHVLTLYNTLTQTIEDVYVFDILGIAKRNYKGVRRVNGEYEYFDFELIKDNEDDYFGFSIDGNKRFIICDDIVTHNSEVRQATEAGIPLVEELAKKLSAAKGEMVSTAEVMDMISKRQISFGMVKEVFDDMTDAGGLFYNMQEKQAQTLYGMWAKLGDAASVMYEEVGNTTTMNSGMKVLIQTLTDMMRHWKALASILSTVVVGFGVYKAAMAGMIPFYKLNYTSVMNTIKAEKLHEQVMLKKLSRFATLTAAQQKQIASTNSLTAAEWRRYITEGKLSQVAILKLARQSANNKELQTAIIKTKTLTRAQLAQVQSMSKMQFMTARLKAGFDRVVGSIKAMGTAMKSFLPLAIITSVIELITGWASASEAQNEAIEKVNKAYDETRLVLQRIKNAYEDIKNSARGAGESEQEFLQASYSGKLEQLQKVVDLLDNYGLKNAIDLSEVNYDTIDEVLTNWLNKLNDVNEGYKTVGTEYARVANAYEANVFGWSIAGENLNSDLKDLQDAWSDLTLNKDFNLSLEQLRATIDDLENNNKDVYRNITTAIKADAALALQKKRNNETELQYQMRIHQNYVDIMAALQTQRINGDFDGLMPNMTSADANLLLTDYKAELDEVRHEFDKFTEAFRNQDALTVRMEIDKLAAENAWTDWQKEELINYLNEDPITINAEIIPINTRSLIGSAYTEAKAILSSEFGELFTPEELTSFTSLESIIEAIEQKLGDANKEIQNSARFQNNIVAGSKEEQKMINKLKDGQKKLNELISLRSELETLQSADYDKLTDKQRKRLADLKALSDEFSDTAINNQIEYNNGLVTANTLLDERITKTREAAQAQRKLAESALNRFTNMGLSDLGKDVKKEFSDLIIDPVKQATDPNYSTKGLISTADLTGVRDAGELYDKWVQNTKALTDEKEKLKGIGISEVNLAKAQVELDERNAKLKADLAKTEATINSEATKRVLAEIASLNAQMNSETNEKNKNKLLERRNELINTEIYQAHQLAAAQRPILLASIANVSAAQAANQHNADYLDDIEKRLKRLGDLGERYNFHLPENNNNGHGRGEDPWITLMKNRMKFMQDFQKGTEELSNWMGYGEGLSQEQKTMLNRGLSLQIDSRELNGTRKELEDWYEKAIEEVRARIGKLGGKEWSGLGVEVILGKDTKNRVIKKYQELLADMYKEWTDFNTKYLKEWEKTQMELLAAEISRTKEAKEFYEKILKSTDNEELAYQATFSVYGMDTMEAFTSEVEQIEKLFDGVDISGAINKATRQIDYKKLRAIWTEQVKLAEYNKRVIPEEFDNQIKSILDAGDKLSKRQIERWSKDLEKAKEYADKRIDLAQYTAENIAEIEAKRDSLDPASKNYASQVAMYNKLIADYQERERNEAAKLDYEQVKEQIGMFDDLGVRIGEAFTDILDGLRKYTQSTDFARLGADAQKNVYAQIAKIEDRMAEGFQGIGVSTVANYVREYSYAAGEYLTAQEELKKATLAAIEADKKWNAVRSSSDEEAKAAALAEKQLADSRVRTAGITANAAAVRLQTSQDSAARASNKFSTNLNKVEESLESLSGGALKTLWDLVGEKGKRNIGNLLSGSKRTLKAIDDFNKKMLESGISFDTIGDSVKDKLVDALANIDPKDLDALKATTQQTLTDAFMNVGMDEELAKQMAEQLSGATSEALAAYSQGQKNLGDAAGEIANGAKKGEKAMKAVQDGANATGEMWGAIISLILSLLDEFGENGVGTFLGDLLNDIAEAVEGILSTLITDAIPKILAGVANVVKGLGTGLGDMLTFGVFDLTGTRRYKKAEKKIAKLQEEIDSLSYSIERLDVAMEKAFGGEYIKDFQKKIEDLQATQAAYEKQAAAERSKGKKKDKDKIKEYEEAARDTADQIRDMQDELIEHFTGTSRTDLARSMAESWLDARVSLSDTFAAIKSDYSSMIKTMIVEGAAAKVIENALTPMWDSVDRLLKEGDVDGAINSLVDNMDSALYAANNGMELLYNKLEAQGLNMKDLLGDSEDSEYTGIAKRVATASSEEINANTAALNTQNYYMSTINENVLAIRQLISGGGVASAETAGWTDWQQQAMDNYNAIARNTADAVVECRRAAEACEKITRTIKTKGSVSGLNVFLNN